MQPDDANFSFLNTLYGPTQTVQANEAVPGNRRLSRAVPDHVRDALDGLDDLIDVGHVQPHWRQLHADEHGAAHEIDLGEGFTAQLHIMLAA